MKGIPVSLYYIRLFFINHDNHESLNLSIETYFGVFGQFFLCERLAPILGKRGGLMPKLLMCIVGVKILFGVLICSLLMYRDFSILI